MRKRLRPLPQRPVARKFAIRVCYAAAFDDLVDARAFATLLAAPPTAAWLGALAEPARGGYRRHLAWTVALLPTPRDWAGTRHSLAAALDAPPASRTRAVADAYALPIDALAPLLAWDARTPVPPAPARRAHLAPPPHAVCERRPAFATRDRRVGSPPP